MIGKHYKAHKENVIDLFDKYKTKRGDLDDGINIKFLESRIDSLRKRKFTLAVAGEVKAGKSTFINALLGEELLPSDVLQASSAIVEIFKSETSFLKVKYADGKKESIYDDLETHDTDKPNERLHEICKIHDEYRQIPTTLIDSYIIASDSVLTVDDAFIKQLEHQSGYQLQHNPSVIKKYISERTKDKIAVEIEFGYPLKWEFDELRIVDSPGVNATGGVQDVSFRFFEEANAILFVHPIKPIESESFRKFVDSVISNRSKETLFLILTHAGLYSNDEVERLLTEARRLYKNVIPENRILVVDSLLKLIHYDLDNGVSVEEIRKSESKKKILSSYREQAKDEGKELIDVVLEGSRFEKMFAAIDEFSMKAPNLQLQEILEKIKAGYEEQENQYTEKSERLWKKKRNPQEFEKEINCKNEAFEKCKLLANQNMENLKSDYSGRHSSWQKDIEALKAKYPELITTSDSIEIARKHTADAIYAVQEKTDDFWRELKQRHGDVLGKTGKTFKEEHQISIPKVDLNALEQKAKEVAYREEPIYEDEVTGGRVLIGAAVGVLSGAIVGYLRGGPVGALISGVIGGAGGAPVGAAIKKRVKTGTKQVFDHEKFLGECKTKWNEEFYKIVNDLLNKSKEVFDIYFDLFSKEMNSIIGDHQKALEKEKEKKQSNEEIISEIQELGRKKNDIHSEKSRCIEVLEDIR
jgi:ribosome biogenesis GTPase A/uncharacterized protein YcfJ